MQKVCFLRFWLALSDGTAIALNVLHGCRWVHRDISAGNTYLYEGRGLLGDLEYAKIMESGGLHETRAVYFVHFGGQSARAHVSLGNLRFYGPRGSSRRL